MRILPVAGIAVLLGGCIGAADDEDPELEFRVLHIEQFSSDRGIPQVAFNVTVAIENVGYVDYEVMPADWSFQTDTGMTAFVGGVVYAGDDFDANTSLVLDPGESTSFIFKAFQLESTNGNLTSLSFRGGAAEPIGGMEP